MHGDSRFISSTLLKVGLVLQCLIVIVEQWPCPPGSTLHVTPYSGLQVSNRQNVFFPLTCKDLILRGTSVTER